MDELKMERTIRETLKNSAEGLEAPDRLKTRIDFALRSGEAPAPVRRRAKWGKKLAAVCLVAALAVTGAVAGSGIVASSFGSSWSNERMSYAETQAELIAGAKVPESFANGFAFDRGMHEYGGDQDSDGNVIREWTNINAQYEKDGATLTLSTGETHDDGTTVDTSVYDEVREIGGVTVQYSENTYKAVPPDYEPTAEEQAAVEAGDLQIGYGSSSVETHDAQFLRWTQDGVTYTMHGFDLGLTADELFAMAQEVIEA